ncbi:MAG: LEPR-XLL domain-containing protein, partial [Verrucomicrobiota bacterium]
MRPDSEGRQFRLEELEPRVLLSANLTALGTAAVVARHHSPVVDEVSLPSTTACLSETHFAYDPAAGVQDMFAGVEQTPPAAPPAPAQSQSRAAAPTVDQGAPGARVQETPTTLATVNTAAPGGHAVSKILRDDSTSPQPPGASNSASKVSELTRTLRSANGPPSGATAAQVSPNFAAIVGSSPKVCGAASVVCGALPTVTATAALAPGSGSPSNPSHATPLGRTPGLQDLGSYIIDLLASSNASFTSTENLASASLGGFLQLQGVTLGVTATLSAAGVWSGSVTISVASATLFPGQSFSGKITSSTSDPALTGTYTIGGGFSLTVPQTASMVLQLGGALTITASGVSLSYDPNGAATQTLATLQTATVTSGQFSGMPSATLSNFAIRGDGFSFSAFTLTSATGATPGIGNFITTTGVTLTVSNFNVSFGTDTSGPSLSGTIAATISGLNLFPDGNLVQFQATNVSAAYSFAGFDGVSSTGQLQVTVSGLQLSMGEAFVLTASGVVVLTPGQPVMATVASATLSSPQFTGLGTLQVSNLVLSQTGFSLGSLTWSSNGPVSIPDIVNADSATLTLSNFALQYGDTPSVSGGISVSAANVVLFPTVPLLNLHLGTLGGSYQFHSPAILSLHIPSLAIPLGDALTINLGEVDINPGQTTMLHVDSATVTVNLFSGLQTTLHNFNLTHTGFSLGSFDITSSTPVTAGSFLSFSNLGF